MDRVAAAAGGVAGGATNADDFGGAFRSQPGAGVLGEHCAVGGARSGDHFWRRCATLFSKVASRLVTVWERESVLEPKAQVYRAREVRDRDRRFSFCGVVF